MTEVCALYVTSREVLVTAMKSGPQPVIQLNSQEMPCNYYAPMVVYQTVEDIPYESVPCPCGDQNHWLLKYESV